MAVGPKVKKQKRISRGRPPLLNSHSATLSSKATRSIIRSHHTLRKEHAKALEHGDTIRADELGDIIASQGGLNSYQLASTLGQSSERGGDSSKVLVAWLKETATVVNARNERLRLLEVGALSTRNACSQVKCFDITRIDLHSQEPEIQEIDFMNLPIPKREDQKFSILSLSLVLNFVPDAAARGAMLKRTCDFLNNGSTQPSRTLLPCLFLVLPLPCVSNSRYLTEEKLAEIMEGLGFSSRKVKKTVKLFYSLWNYDPSNTTKVLRFKKEEVRSGASRNNFAIVL